MGGSQIQTNMSNSNGETPLQEAVSIITIVSILAAVGCYVGAANHVPLITPAVAWTAGQVYSFCPSLGYLRGDRAPILAASAAVGIVLFLLTIPFSYWLANVFARAGYASIDRQTIQLKRFRQRRKNTKRDGDSFTIGEGGG
jgi:hypothetical protein